ncbi:hypothetical protein Poly24_49810 [Rosistilla carotiformis]|uniref:RedB protein n=1 Tax=Rosistilla carotiformis TaxID=2528017 RepID=A0A518K0C5_9BACT|nr:hypothetical protein [Rosistilla carotiformis]QDV71246.1 hypothetical protein Poly24_49810 [Rosistilla carotiformis]
MKQSAIDSRLAADRFAVTWAPRSRRTWLLLTSVWCVAVTAYCFWMTAYGLGTHPENLSRKVAVWPADATLPRDPDRPTLVLFLHPRCFCSEATVEQLQTILRSAKEAQVAIPNTLVVACMPANAPSDWRDSRLNLQSRQLPDSIFINDVDGVECGRFGVNTSGTVMLFDAAGRRRFSGGITIARGQVGESHGGRLLREGLAQIDASIVPAAGTLAERQRHVSPPVFGCKLLSPPDPQWIVGSTLTAKERVQ